MSEDDITIETIDAPYQFKTENRAKITLGALSSSTVDPGDADEETRKAYKKAQDKLRGIGEFDDFTIKRRYVKISIRDKNGDIIRSDTLERYFIEDDNNRFVAQGYAEDGGLIWTVTDAPDEDAE